MGFNKNWGYIKINVLCNFLTVRNSVSGTPFLRCVSVWRCLLSFYWLSCRWCGLLSVCAFRVRSGWLSSLGGCAVVRLLFGGLCGLLSGFLNAAVSEAVACPLWLSFVPLACVCLLSFAVVRLACVGCPEGCFIGFRAVVSSLVGCRLVVACFACQ